MPKDLVCNHERVLATIEATTVHEPFDDTRAVKLFYFLARTERNLVDSTRAYELIRPCYLLTLSAGRCTRM